MNLDDLMQRAPVWRGGSVPPPSGLTTGYPDLDASLLGGWPQGGLVEVLSTQRGIGELRLVLPTLVRVTQGERWVAFVSPPYLPYAPAFARAGVHLAHVLVVRPRARTDVLWAVEQALRSGSCGVVCAWLQQADRRSLRRLQLAAETGNSVGFLFREASAAQTPSPASVRVQLASAQDGSQRLIIHLLKRKGGWPLGPIALDVKHALAVSAFSNARA